MAAIRPGDLITPLREAVDGGLTLPASWYTDPAVFLMERDAIFLRTWQFVARIDQLERPGDYVAASVGDVPVVVVRDEDGELRAFFNICRHRLHEVAVGEGNRKTLQCRYHGWTYGLDGTLRAAPRSEREADFDACAFSLLPLQVGAFGPLVLVNADRDAPPLTEAYGELGRVLESRHFDVSRLTFRSRDEYELSCNWKVFIENSVECYHCPTAHPQFGKGYVVDPDVYRLEEYDGFSAQTTRSRQDDGTETDYQFYYVFPNLFFVPTAWRDDGRLAFCRIFVVIPLDADRALHVCLSYCDDSIDDEAAAEYDELGKLFQSQDRELIASVQRCQRAGVVEQGRLLIDSERLIRHFYALLERALAS